MSIPLPKQTFPVAATIVSLTRMLLIFLLTYTVISKFTNFPLYRLSMEEQPFSPFLSHALVWVVPATEALASFLLLSGRTAKAGLWLALILLAVFTFYTALIVSGYYRRMPCPCGGLVSGLGWTGHLALNLFFLALTIASLRLYRHAEATTILRNQEKPNTCLKQ